MKKLCRNAALTALLLFASALLLSGCATFASPPTASQNQVIGSVQIAFTVCASGGGSGGTCATFGNSGSSPSTAMTQVFVGFRVPSGTGAPQSFNSSVTAPIGSGPQLQFTESSAYAGELQRLDPAPAGEEWFGYTSQYVSYDTASGDQNFSASIDFALPTHANGLPFTGPFTYQAVVGGRQASGGTPDPSQPIDCQSSLTESWGGFDAYRWICVDDSQPADLDTDSTLETRDAGIEPGATTSVMPGATATVPFTFAYAGTAAPEASFSFQAATTVPGVAATPSITTLAPATDSSKTVNVSVPVPAHTAPGNYSVTLTARLSDGEYRNGTATLVVNAAPVVSPAMASSLPPSISGATRQGSTLFASSGHWTSDPASLGYQWQRCTGPGGVCAAIPQAVHHWYKLVRADVGAKIRVQVSAKSSAGSAQAVSATFGPVAPALASVAAIETALNGVPVPRGLAPLKIRNVLADDGYSFWFSSPGAGRLTIDWYLEGAGSSKVGKQVLVASLSTLFPNARRERVKIALSARGRKLLANAGRLTIACRISFAQTDKATFSRTGRFDLAR